MDSNFSILNQYFDKILVLSIPRLKERQALVKQRLQGLEFEFFFGVDKQELTDTFVARDYHYDKKNSLSISQYFKPMNRGEIACALSHRKIYQAMVDNDWKTVLIFEDDVVVSEYFDGLPVCLQQLPANWELLYLGYIKNDQVNFAKRIKQGWYQLQARLGLGKMPVSMISKMLPRNYSPSLYKAGFHDCTHAYAISRPAAEKLLKAQTPVIYRADNLLSAMIMKGQLNGFACRHSLFNQEIFTDAFHPSEVRDGAKISI